MLPTILNGFTFALMTICVLVALTFRRSQFKTIAILVLLLYQGMIQLAKVQLLEDPHWQAVFFLRFPLLYFAIPLTVGLALSRFQKITWQHGVHLLPGVLALGVWWSCYFQASGQVQWATLQNTHHGFYPLWLQWMDGIAWLILAPLYGMGIWHWFRKLDRNKALRPHRRPFFQVYMLMAMGLAGLGMVRKILEITLSQNDTYQAKLTLDILKIVLIVMTVFILSQKYIQGIVARQSQMLRLARRYRGTKEGPNPIPGETSHLPNSKLKTPPELVLPESQIQSIHERLLAALEKELLYLRPKLSLDELAAELDLSPTHLSFVINQREQTNFSNLINRYRIEWFLHTKKDPGRAHYSTLGLALEAGFNSKSAFYAAFKKAKGTTPSKYLEKRALENKKESRFTKQDESMR